ncbi:hypothetical protein [Actinomadura atramentaria]|uniref:hypothetical protein n=1 Tax=Actinomadura atramentaria TaxID=1990 RepID=UPI0003768C30|nr:hypothetical protein [Actinomadura atramentaria]
MVIDGHVEHLEGLGRELGTRGLVARVVGAPGGPVFLRVINPDAASLAEDVTCAPAPETSDAYFWWSWGERLHRADDPRAAAAKLAHVLRPHHRSPDRSAGHRPDLRHGPQSGRDARPHELRLREPRGHTARGLAAADPALRWQAGHP